MRSASDGVAWDHTVRNGMNFAAIGSGRGAGAPSAGRFSERSGRGTNHAPVASNRQARPWRRRMGLIDGWYGSDRLSKTARRRRYFAQSASKLVGRAGAIYCRRDIQGREARCPWARRMVIEHESGVLRMRRGGIGPKVNGRRGRGGGTRRAGADGAQPWCRMRDSYERRRGVDHGAI